MGMVVRTNVNAMNANRQLGVNNSQLSKNIEKLSSGFKINRAGDDASGLAISEKMKAQIKGLETASANSQDGISLIQTAEGALTEVHDMLNRMTELATKSANGTIQDEVDRDAIQAEVDALNTEITRISKSTNFNGINLLDGSLSMAGKTTTTGGGYAQVGVADVLQRPNASTAAGVTPTNAIGGAYSVTDPQKAIYDTGALVTDSTDGDSYKVDFTFQDKNGETKNYSIEIMSGAAGDKARVKVNGEIFESATVTYGATNTLSRENIGDLALEALNKTDVADEFNITTGANGALTFTAKEGGRDASKLLAMNVVEKATTDSVNTQKSVAVTVTQKGDDSKASLDVSKIGYFDASESAANTSGNASSKADEVVFTVDGQKFAFVKQGSKDAAKAALGEDVHLIEVSATTGGGITGKALDASAADKFIAEAKVLLGNDIASTSGGATIITFDKLKPETEEKNGTGEGLTLQIGDTDDDFNKVTVSVDDLSAKGIGTDGLDVSNQVAAGKSIDVIKKAINQVSTNRANLGALQNRLEHTINNLDTTAENMTSANSRVRDTDMAKQMMEYTKVNVLSQSAQAMLAQANQQPQSILQLLQ